MGLSQHALMRQISEMVQFGTIEAVQAAPLRYRVRFDEERLSGWIRQGLLCAGGNREWRPLDIGEQVLVVKPLGLAEGVIVCSVNRDQHPQPKDNLELYYKEFQDGTWFQYDREKKSLTFHCVGDVVGTVANGTTLNSELTLNGNFTLNGNLIQSGSQQVEGSIASAGNVSAAGSMAAQGDVTGKGGISLLHHKHGGVQSGSSATEEAQ